MKEITLNLGGDNYKFLYNQDFSKMYLWYPHPYEAYHPFAAIKIACGHTFGKADIVLTIQHKLSQQVTA